MAMTGTPPHLVLRSATAACHDRVDAAFARFRLDDRRGYGEFLTAHARALPLLEAAIGAVHPLIAYAPRLPLLRGDLAVLGLPAPEPAPLEGSPDQDAATCWGLAYVLEGSRMGGAMLARSVEAGLPRSFLSAAHGPGEWRRFRAMLDQALTPDRLPQAIDAARAAFALYEQAVTAHS